MIIICCMLVAIRTSAQEYKCILFSDTMLTRVSEKVKAETLEDMSLILQVPVIDSVENYWTLIVEIHSEYTNYYFTAKLNSDYIKKNCIGKEFIYLKVISPDGNSDFYCSNQCNEGDPLNYNLLCNKRYKSYWADDKAKYQDVTATAIYLGEWVTNYNGSDIYERKEIENVILKIKTP